MGVASVNLHFGPSHREGQTLTHSPSYPHLKYSTAYRQLRPLCLDSNRHEPLGFTRAVSRWIPPTEKFYPQYHLAYFSLDEMAKATVFSEVTAVERNLYMGTRDPWRDQETGV